MTEAPVWTRLPSTGLAEMRKQMAAFRKVANEEALSLKNCQLALDRLQALYRGFTSTERVLVAKILAEWILSEDETVRFDAMVLADRFRIRDVTPALSELAHRLRHSKVPSAVYELKQVDRLAAALAAG